MKEAVTIEEPTFTGWLFVSRQAAWIWLVVRVWLGYQWLHAGWEKITGTSGGTWSWQFAFTGDSWLKTSAGLKGFAAFALKNTQGPNAPVNYGWYAHFLHYLSTSGGWMAPVIAIGETVIGLALILGLFTGLAAFFAGILTTSFGLAGIAGVNPVFFIAEVFLILAWRNAGYYGLDRWVLPALGTPWHRGTVFEHREDGPPQTIDLTQEDRVTSGGGPESRDDPTPV
jgi:thiosulfate dehydrogenase (quinone) large subunit